MGFKKSSDNGEIRVFNEFLEAKEVFEDKEADEDLRLAALDYIVRHKEISYVLRMLSEIFKENKLNDHVYIDYAFSAFTEKPKREEDFQKMFAMLKSDNAYLRNAAVSFLQGYGEDVKQFIENLINNEDRDIRIFAANILGDLRFDGSVDLLRYLIMKENDINVLMSAVDYLGEVGSKEDIAILESIKESYKDEPYVAFGVDAAINKLRE